MLGRVEDISRYDYLFMTGPLLSWKFLHRASIMISTLFSIYRRGAECLQVARIVAEGRTGGGRVSLQLSPQQGLCRDLPV